MSKRETGGPAFPTKTPHFNSLGDLVNYNYTSGLSLRDYFAGQAIEGIPLLTVEVPAKAIAEDAYILADAMLLERGKGENDA